MALASISTKDPTKKNAFSTSLPRILSGEGALGFGTEGGATGLTFGGLSGADLLGAASMMAGETQSSAPFGEAPGSAEATAVTGGPGPVTAQSLTQAVANAALRGQDPTQAFSQAVAPNQADIAFADAFNTMMGRGRTLTNLTTLAGRMAGLAIPAIPGPVGFPLTVMQQALRQLSTRAKAETTQGARMAQETARFIETNVPPPTVSGEAAPGEGVPGAPSGGQTGVGTVGGLTGSLGFGEAPPSGTVAGFTGEVGPAAAATAEAAAQGTESGIPAGPIGEGEASDGGAGAGAAGDGGTYICTAYNTLGYLEGKEWMRCSVVGRNMPADVMRGYQRWALGFSLWLLRHPFAAWLMWPLARRWKNELLGRRRWLLMRVAVPICRWLGR